MKTTDNYKNGADCCDRCCHTLIRNTHRFCSLDAEDVLPNPYESSSIWSIQVESLEIIARWMKSRQVFGDGICDRFKADAHPLKSILKPTGANELFKED